MIIKVTNYYQFFSSIPFLIIDRESLRDHVVGIKEVMNLANLFILPLIIKYLPFEYALRDWSTTSSELIRYPAIGLEFILALMLKLVLVYPGQTPNILMPESLYSS